MLQHGHYEIDANQGHGMPIVTRYVYRPRELAAVIASIIETGDPMLVQPQRRHR